MGKENTLELLDDPALNESLRRPGIIDTNFQGLLEGILERQARAGEAQVSKIKDLKKLHGADSAQSFSKLTQAYDTIDRRIIADYQALMQEMIDIVDLVEEAVNNQPNTPVSIDTSTTNNAAYVGTRASRANKFAFDNFLERLVVDVRDARHRIGDKRSALDDRQRSIDTLYIALANNVQGNRGSEFDDLNRVRKNSTVAQREFLESLMGGSIAAPSTGLLDYFFSNLYLAVNKVEALDPSDTTVNWAIDLELVVIQLCEILMELAKAEKDFLRITGSPSASGRFIGPMYTALGKAMVQLRNMDHKFWPGNTNPHVNISNAKIQISAYKDRLTSMQTRKIMQPDKIIDATFARQISQESEELD